MNTTPSTKALIGYIDQALGAGHAPSQVAHEVNLSPRRIWLWLNRKGRPDLAGCFHSPQPPRGRPCAEDGCYEPRVQSRWCPRHRNQHRQDSTSVDAEARLEDLEWMIAAGESPVMMATRLGLKPGALSRWLRNHHRPDLAGIFETERRRGVA